MEIKGLAKTTLLDYPGHVAATLFVGNCQFKCPFCHNGSLVTGASQLPNISLEEVYAFLEKRRGVLDGVCITGGEPTFQPDLKELLFDIKSWTPMATTLFNLTIYLMKASLTISPWISKTAKKNTQKLPGFQIWISPESSFL